MKSKKTTPGTPLPFRLMLCGAALVLAGLTGCNETEEPLQGNVKVFKYSERLQCEPDSGISLEDMQMELVDAGIDVLCAQIGNDLLAYSALCGESTGDINVYEIRRVNFEDALALGFLDVSVLSDYVDRVCR